MAPMAFWSSAQSHPVIASLMFARASCSSLPCEIQPGRAGHSTMIQPSSTGSIVTWKIIVPSQIQSIVAAEIRKNYSLRRMVDYDLPALVCLFEDKREYALGCPAVLLCADEIVLAQADGEGITQGMHLKLGKR